MATEVSRNSITDASGTDAIWRLSTNVTVLIGWMVAFWLGVVVTMLTYQVGFLERVR